MPPLRQQNRPIDSNLWWMALEHLESRQVPLLEELLRKHRLRSHLDNAVTQHVKAEVNLRQRAPHLNDQEIEELSLPTWILPEPRDEEIDPDPPPELSPLAAKLLDAFKKNATDEISP